MADDTSSLINVDRLTTYHGLITDYIDDKCAVGDGAVEAVNTLIEDTSTGAKILLAESITNKGVAIDRTATYPEMAAAIDSIKTGSGTATPDQVLEGATFTNSSGEELTGTIPVVDITSPVTPGVNDITLINGNSYINNQVVIKGDSKLAGGNIRSGSSIFGINGEFTADATAVAANILTGKTAGINGTMVTGTMPNIGSITKSLNCGESYTIDGGFHDGTGKITAASLASQTSATATAAQILSGQTAWVNGSLVTGTIASLAAKTYTPGTSNQTIAAGQYLSGAQTIAGSSNLVASNIKSGVKIFNVTGTLEEGDSLVSVKKSYSTTYNGSTGSTSTFSSGLTTAQKSTLYSFTVSGTITHYAGIDSNMETKTSISGTAYVQSSDTTVNSSDNGNYNYIKYDDGTLYLSSLYMYPKFSGSITFYYWA